MRYCAILAGCLLALCGQAALASGNVVEMEIKGGIGVAMAEYVVGGIEHAEESGAELVIINMDTPGGLDSAMRDINRAILSSEVPVVTYVNPSGARAASAGTYILMASHIAAMAPTTHLGAATPVNLGGGDATPPLPDREPEAEPEAGSETKAPADADADAENDDAEAADETPSGALPGTAMERKVLNDAVAYIRGLAERHGRNADWAEDAVVSAATLTADEALAKGVVDVVAVDRADLLKQINGRDVKVGAATVALDTTDVVVETFEPNWRIKILQSIASPEVALLLGMIGLYGLMYEGWNPGAVVPGVVGIICLLLAAYALQVLPVNYAGLALIIVGLALMTAEAFAPSFGALGLGGIAAFVFGAIMMFDSGVPGFGISIGFVIGLAIVAALFIIWLMTFVLRLRRRGAVSGRDSIVGGTGRAMHNFTADGKVWLEGEAWSARSSVPVRKGQSVVVIAMDGLVLDVEPVADTDTGRAQLQT